MGDTPGGNRFSPSRRGVKYAQTSLDNTCKGRTDGDGPRGGEGRAMTNSAAIATGVHRRRPGLRWRAATWAVAVILGGTAMVGCGPSPGPVTSSAAAPGGSSATAATAATQEPEAGCQQVGSVSFDKTKFVLPAGLAFGAFHHFISQPLQAGALSGVDPLAKAGLAAVFTAHELKLAKVAAESSPTLCHQAEGFDEVAMGLAGLAAKIKDGRVNPGKVAKLDGKVHDLQAGAAAAGAPAPDQVPTDAQLAAGHA